MLEGPGVRAPGDAGSYRRRAILTRNRPAAVRTAPARRYATSVPSPAPVTGSVSPAGVRTTGAAVVVVGTSVAGVLLELDGTGAGDEVLVDGLGAGELDDTDGLGLGDWHAEQGPTGHPVRVDVGTAGL
jgi:hypothetical protein